MATKRPRGEGRGPQTQEMPVSGTTQEMHINPQRHPAAHNVRALRAELKGVEKSRDHVDLSGGDVRLFPKNEMDNIRDTIAYNEAVSAIVPLATAYINPKRLSGRTKRESDEQSMCSYITTIVRHWVHDPSQRQEIPDAFARLKAHGKEKSYARQMPMNAIEQSLKDVLSRDVLYSEHFKKFIEEYQAEILKMVAKS